MDLERKKHIFQSLEEEVKNMPLHGKKVLVVDDSITIRMQVKELLEENSFDVLLAENGIKCLEVLENETKPDIILLDIIMPELDGIETCKKIKKSQLLNNIPVIILTSESDVKSKVNGLNAGADDYLTKPFEIEELMARLTSIINRLELQNQLKKEQQEFKFLVENTTDVIWTSDLSFQSTYVSPSVVAITGYTPSEIMSKTIEERFTPSSIEIISNVFTEEIENEKDRTKDPNRSRFLELEMNCKSGITTWIEMNATFIRDSHGTPTGLHGIYRDISERKLIESALKKTNIELEKSKITLEEKANQSEMANKNKSEFLANMSHELRSPLNSILLLSNHLATNKPENLTDDQIECAETINSSGKDLLKLIDEILDLAKVESGNIEVVPQIIYLETLKQKMLRYYTYQARDKGINFHINIDSSLPDTIYSDKQRLEQILKNLISNALKFTSQGDITLSISNSQKSKEELSEIGLTGHISDKTIAFSVTDTGIGIPQDKLGHIFAAYSQAEATTTRDFGGTGLGLPISKMLARLLNGDVVVESKELSGSTFTLYLPEKLQVKKKEKIKSDVKENDEPLNTIDSNSEFLPLLNRKKILLVEDDMRSAFALSAILTTAGMNVKISINGVACLEQLSKNENYDLILMDIKLPEMNGLEAISRIREIINIQKIPIISITASAMESDREKCMEAGADMYMAKPVEINRLIQMMAELV